MATPTIDIFGQLASYFEPPKTGTYYNTTKEVNPQLELFQQKNKKQDDLILDFFRKNPSKKYLRETIASVHYNYPSQSIVRSLNTLMNANLIEKLEEMKVGSYGRRCHLYQLKK
jgi:hypothetical protein